MSIVLKPGTRLFGARCQTEAIVVRAPDHAVDVRIGGLPALLDAAERTEDQQVSTPAEAAAQLGKRYIDDTGELELLCTKAGSGAFGVSDRLCSVKEAKPLPGSD
jgi:hypothetical protein